MGDEEGFSIFLGDPSQFWLFSMEPRKMLGLHASDNRNLPKESSKRLPPDSRSTCRTTSETSFPLLAGDSQLAGQRGGDIPQTPLEKMRNLKLVK